MSNSHDQEGHSQHWSQRLWEVVDQVSREHDAFSSGVLWEVSNTNPTPHTRKKKNGNANDRLGSKKVKDRNNNNKSSSRYHPTRSSRRHHEMSVLSSMSTSSPSDSGEERDYINNDSYELLRTDIKISKYRNNLEVVSDDANKVEATMTTTTSLESVEKQNGKGESNVPKRGKKLRTQRKCSNRYRATQCSNNRSLKCNNDTNKCSTARTLLNYQSKSMRVVPKVQTNNQVCIDKDQHIIIRDDHTKRNEQDDRTTKEDKQLQDCLPDEVSIIEHHEIHKEEPLYRVMPTSCGENIQSPPPTSNTDIGAVRLLKARDPGFIAEENNTADILTDYMSIDETDYTRSILIDQNRLSERHIPWNSTYSSESLEVLETIGNREDNIVICEQSQMIHDRDRNYEVNQVDEKFKLEDVGKTWIDYYKKTNEVPYLNNMSATTYCASVHTNNNLAPSSSMKYLPVQQPEEPPISMPMDNITFIKCPPNYETLLEAKISANSVFEERFMSGPSPMSGSSPMSVPIDLDNTVEHCMVDLERKKISKIAGQLINSESTCDGGSSTLSCDGSKINDLSSVIKKKPLSFGSGQDDSEFSFKSVGHSVRKDCKAIDKVPPESTSSCNIQLPLSPKLCLSTTSTGDNRWQFSTHETQLYSSRVNGENCEPSQPISFKQQDRGGSHFKRVQELNSEMKETQMVLAETETLINTV